MREADVLRCPPATDEPAVVRPQRRPTYGLVDPPRAVGRDAYGAAIDRMVRTVRGLPGVRALYQIGSVSSPGISDLDMVAVFADGVVCDVNPVRGLGGTDRYLFIHNLYGAPLQHFARARRLSFFHDYRLLWGEDAGDGGAALTDAEAALLKRQIALEYLVRLYAVMALQRAYRTVKVRGFLLHVKAVAYDLEFLGITDGTLHDLTRRFVDWRAAWFEDAPDPGAFIRAYDAFYDALVSLLDGVGEVLPFYAPGPFPYRIARSLWLRPGPRLGVRQVGVRPPPALRVLGSRYFKLANRLNRFEFTVPVAAEAPPPVLTERARLVDAMRAYNRSRLPGFDVLTTSL